MRRRRLTVTSEYIVADCKVVGILATSMLLALGCSALPGAEERPNIILLHADAVRADYLAFHGFRGDISPRLDHLASESIQFQQCLAAAPWTKPSIASLFTSLDPLHHGMTSAHDAAWEFPRTTRRIERLSERAFTLAEALHDAGYTTAARVSNPWLKSINGFAQGFDDWREEKHGGTGSAEEIIRALRVLERSEPFFLYIHFMEAHGPYGGYAESADRFEQLRRSPSLGRDSILTLAEERRRPSYLGENLSWGGPGAARHLRNWKAAYGVGVHTLDREVGRIVDWLRDSGALDDSLLVFTSDHGEEFLEHGEWEHGRTLCNHQLHVPLLIRLPGAKRAGSVESRPVRLIDVMPTLLAQAGVREPPAELQGIDLSPLLEGREAGGPEFAFATGIKGKPGPMVIQDGRRPRPGRVRVLRPRGRSRGESATRRHPDRGRRKTPIRADGPR